MTTNSTKRRIAAAVAAVALAVTGGGVAAAAGGADLRPADVARGGGSTLERAPEPGSDFTVAPEPR